MLVFLRFQLRLMKDKQELVTLDSFRKTVKFIDEKAIQKEAGVKSPSNSRQALLNIQQYREQEMQNLNATGKGQAPRKGTGVFKNSIFFFFKQYDSDSEPFFWTKFWLFTAN